MLRNIKCSECERSSFTDDSFADIQIPLFEDNVEQNDNQNIADICEIQSFSDIIHKTDYLKDDNKFDCINCSKKTVASVIHSIKILPKILVIYMKKSLQNNYNLKSCKSPKYMFKAPLNLEYSSNGQLIKYELYAFVMHSGSTANNGHYYTVMNAGIQTKSISTRKTNCKCAQNIEPKIGWIKINDDKVRKLNNTHVIKLLEDEDISSTLHLAFYQRIN
jgi:ubiquitin C-terminal hydrolase